MRARFITEARTEFDEAVAWHENQRAGLGDDFMVEVRHTVAAIVANPHAFSPVEGVLRSREIRVLGVDRFDYLVGYEVFTDEIVVLTVRHGRLRPRRWWRRT